MLDIILMNIIILQTADHTFQQNSWLYAHGVTVQ